MTPLSPDRDPELSILIGAVIRAGRIDLRWSERELARRLGTNQRAIQRLESGMQRHINSPLALAALTLLGIRMSFDTNGVCRWTRLEQRDAVHARCCAYVVRHLRRRGWETRVEVEIGDGRFRGWIDVLAFRPADRALLVIEVKTRVDDAGRILRTLGWYTRSSRVAADALGWQPRRIVPTLLLLATVDTDARLTGQRELIVDRLPSGAAELAPWLDDPAAAPAGPSRALIDPASRRRAWLQRDRIDGRRTPVPYRDYRDAAERLTGDR
jgi:transcriptional regulator with XRE-family HTH domain